MKRVFLYARVSTEEQVVHGLSIEAQTEALQAWAKANGCPVVDLYIDAGISARKPASKRPELQRLLADAQAGKGDLIVFTKLDRWFRNIAEYYKVQEILEKCHVDWRTIHEDYDTSTASGRLKINIMLSVAQDEADRTSERIKAVFDAKREKLEPLSGRPPLGYKIEGKKLVKDPETEELVSSFFQKFMTCGSIFETQRYILDTFGLRMNYQRASKILYNKTYYGLAYGMEGMAPAYITEEQFHKIQKMRKKVARKVKENRVYLFSGLIYCGECGLRMASGSNRTKYSSSQFYKCRGHATERSGCMNKTCMNEKALEAYLLGQIDSKVQEYKVMCERIEAERVERSYKPEIAAVRSKIAKLKELYINDFISMDEYRADHAAYTEKLNELLEKDKPLVKPDIRRLEALLTANWKEDYKNVEVKDRRDFWRAILREARIYSDRHIEFDLNV